jgi:uncharacterized protein
MLRDDGSNGPGRRPAPRNVFGEPLEACSINPMTGFYRDGCCNTGREDIGSHTVCVVMTTEFLDFSKSWGALKYNRAREAYETSRRERAGRHQA